MTTYMIEAEKKNLNSLLVPPLVLLSLPFVYEFVNTKWVNMKDFILRKKPGRDEIHLIQILGKMTAEFNTMMKHYRKLAAQS